MKNLSKLFMPVLLILGAIFLWKKLKANGQTKQKAEPVYAGGVLQNPGQVASPVLDVIKGDIPAYHEMTHIKQLEPVMDFNMPVVPGDGLSQTLTTKNQYLLNQLPLDAAQMMFI